MRNIHVSFSGKFNHELLMKTALWMNTTSLVEVVKAIVERIDEIDIDYLLNDGPFLFLKLTFFINFIFRCSERICTESN